MTIPSPKYKLVKVLSNEWAHIDIVKEISQPVGQVFKKITN